VKFQKTDLIARIDALLRHAEGQAIDRAEKLDEQITGSRDAWLEDYAGDFGIFADRIHRRIRNGEPVTIEDIPAQIKGRSNTDLTFYFPPVKGRPLAEERRIDALQQLRNALTASTEDTVSPTAIKQLGFQDVTFLFTDEAATK
jgi:hypothetical protein